MDPELYIPALVAFGVVGVAGVAYRCIRTWEVCHGAAKQAEAREAAQASKRRGNGLVETTEEKD